MRIISGTYKGRRITAPKKLPVRPTTDMAKEALFNILRNHYNLNRVNVLDLFAGTGNISYEFGSRGAEQITAVDSHAACVKFIEQTADEFKMPVTAIKSDVIQYLQKASGKYNIIFADPPYDFETETFLRIVDLVFEGGFLEENGTLVIEHSKHTLLEDHTRHTETRKYGGSAFSFFS